MRRLDDNQSREDVTKQNDLQEIGLICTEASEERRQIVVATNGRDIEPGKYGAGIQKGESQ